MSLRRSLWRWVTKSACSSGELLRFADSATSHATKGRILTPRTADLIALDARGRHEDAEKALWRRTMELSFEGICQMRKGENSGERAEQVRKDSTKDPAVSIFLELPMVQGLGNRWK